MTDDGARDTPHESPPYAAQAPAAHRDQPHSELLGQDGDLLVRASHLEVGPRDCSSRRLYLLYLLVEKVLGVLPEALGTG